MKYLLDTPLLGELVRAKPEDWISRWIDLFNEEDIYLSSISIGEIIRAIENEEDLERMKQLYRWLYDDLYIRFHGRIIPVDLKVIEEWGRITAGGDSNKKPLPVVEGLIAATAISGNFVVITYNREVYLDTGIEVSDPWQG